MNINIQDLPTLTTDNFDSSQDLLLLQKSQIGGVGEPSIFSLTKDLANSQVLIHSASIRFLSKEQHIDSFFYSRGDRRQEQHEKQIFTSKNLTNYGVPSTANHVLLSIVDSTTVGGDAKREVHIRFHYGKYPENYLFQDFVRSYKSSGHKDKGYPIMHTEQFWLPVFKNRTDDFKTLIYQKATITHADLDFYIIAYS